MTAESRAEVMHEGMSQLQAEKQKKKKKGSQKLAVVVGGIGDEPERNKRGVTETREDRVPRSGMVMRQRKKKKKKKLKQRKRHYLRQKKSHRISLREKISGGERG